LRAATPLLQWAYVSALSCFTILEPPLTASRGIALAIQLFFTPGNIVPVAGNASFVVRHSLVALPEPGYQPRRFDPRAGTFGSQVVDFAAPLGSPLASQGDPSSTLINAPFAAAAKSRFVDELGYVASATYATGSNAINSWNFSHDGRALPDTLPDLTAALTLAPTLRVLAISGYHDLATPFRQTELDLARISAPSRLEARAYPGGHMTYLDDGSRRRIRDDVVAWLQAPSPPASSAALTYPARRGTAAIATGRSAAAAPAPAPVVAGPASQPGDLVQGGDPWVPPALRVAPAGPSPHGPALKALVERKVAERLARPYR